MRTVVALVVASALLAAAGCSHDASRAGAVGAPGIGDPAYPALGNGGYQVEHYDLDLRYASTAPGTPLHGSVTARAVATEDLRRFDLDFAGDSVGPVSVDGRPATAARSGEELVVTPPALLPAGRPFTVTVQDFVSTPTTPDPAQLVSSVFVRTADGTAWAAQPDGAHRIFPCNDHPSDKAGFSFRIDVPAGTTAVANGELTSRVTSAGRTVWRYEEREPMATELAQVVEGAVTVLDRGVHNGVQVRDVVPTALAGSLGPQLAVEVSQLDWMRQRVGAYPFRSYGSLVVRADLGFSLETQTLSLFDGAAMGQSPGLRSSVMLHELAHQWFGDAVAPAGWTDVWLNEGHATWYEYQYAAEQGYLGQDAGAGDLTAVMRAAYADGDRLRAEDGPVAAPRSTTVLTLFNENVYRGGALVLYALRQRIGAAAFDRLERAWVTRYSGRSASTHDFIALAGEIAHADLKPFLTAWLDGTTTPPMPGHQDWTVTPVGHRPAGAT